MQRELRFHCLLSRVRLLMFRQRSPDRMPAVLAASEAMPQQLPKALNFKALEPHMTVRDTLKPQEQTLHCPSEGYVPRSEGGGTFGKGGGFAGGPSVEAYPKAQ